MDILALRVRLTDADATLLLKRIPEAEMPVKDVKVHFAAEGVVVEGTYPTMLLSVPFRMTWRLDVIDGKLRASLANLDFYGVPAGPFRGTILSFVHDEAARIPGLSRDGDTILIDAGVLASSTGIPITLTPREVLHEAGALVFSAGE
jgi:hypothetical protein